MDGYTLQKPGIYDSLYSVSFTIHSEFLTNRTSYLTGILIPARRFFAQTVEATSAKAFLWDFYPGDEAFFGFRDATVRVFERGAPLRKAKYFGDPLRGGINSLCPLKIPFLFQDSLFSHFARTCRCITTITKDRYPTFRSLCNLLAKSAPQSLHQTFPL